MSFFAIRRQTFALAAIMVLSWLAPIHSEELDVTGFGRSRLGFQTDDRALFINDQTLEAAFDWETGETALHALTALTAGDDGEDTFELKELYVQLYGDFVDIRIGMQPVIWGKADGMFITDQVSPKNLTDFLTRDVAELRRAVTGAKADFFKGSHRLELVYLPVFTPTLLPANDSIWYAAKELPVEPTMEEASMPEPSLENAEYFARYSWAGSIADIQVLGGWFWNDTPIPSVVGREITPGVGLTGITIRPEYYRTALAGFAASAPVGPLLLKTEAAANMNQRLSADIGKEPEGWKEKNTIVYMAGAEGSLLGATVSVQAMQDIVLDYEESLSREQLLTTATLAVSRLFLNDTVKSEVFWYAGLNERDSMIKPQLTWMPGNGFQAAAGGWFFLGDEGQFGQYSDNNGVFISASYYF